MSPTQNASVPASIFRAYDIRGIVDETLTEASVKLIGRAIGSEAAARGEPRVRLVNGVQLVDLLAEHGVVVRYAARGELVQVYASSPSEEERDAEEEEEPEA